MPFQSHERDAGIFAGEVIVGGKLGEQLLDDRNAQVGLSGDVPRGGRGGGSGGRSGRAVFGDDGDHRRGDQSVTIMHPNVR